MQLDGVVCDGCELCSGSGYSLDSSQNFEAEEFTAYRFWKRLFDVLFSGLALVVLLPLLLVTAIAIRLDSGGSVIYAQLRAGKNGTVFKMYKFRSMCEDAEEQLGTLRNLNEKDGPVFKITKDPRTTRVGRIIRKLSIDELPQLVNVIKGEMSLVGPRPPLLSEVERYSPLQRQRLSVQPGLTCYWQISGRSRLGFSEWMRLDLKYIRERGLWTDLKILMRTVPVVLLGRGAY